MTTTAQLSPLRKFGQNLSLLFTRPARTQLAAFCYREGKSGPEVLLITTRDTKRLIIPKGWPMANHSARHTAKTEAYEEAGIIGKVGKAPIGEFPSYKGMGNGFRLKTTVIVFPLRVEKQIENFPESGERKLLWLPLNEAIERCEDEGLRKFLSSSPVNSLLMSNN